MSITFETCLYFAVCDFDLCIYISVYKYSWSYSKQEWISTNVTLIHHKTATPRPPPCPCRRMWRCHRTWNVQNHRCVNVRLKRSRQCQQSKSRRRRNLFRTNQRWFLVMLAICFCCLPCDLCIHISMYVSLRVMVRSAMVGSECVCGWIRTNITFIRHVTDHTHRSNLIMDGRFSTKMRRGLKHLEDIGQSLNR